MLDLMYSKEALAQQFAIGHEFLLAATNEEPAGFASHSLVVGDTDVLKIHKLYVLPAFHGQGVGKALVDAIQEYGKPHGATTMRVDVNRNNAAVGFYTRSGFRMVGERITDIGGGFVMDDLVMEKRIR